MLDIWSNAKISPRFKFNEADLWAWGKNAFVFLAPTLVFLIADLIKALPTWITDNPALVAVLVYVLNRITDIIRRFVDGKK